MTRRSALPPELLGLRLHGDGLDDAALAAWFADEENGYFAIAGGTGDSHTAGVNRYHAFRHLGERRFALCLALGAAWGGEYAGLTGRIGSFVAVEPGRKFWQGSIAGAPAEYRLPTLRGAIDLPDGGCDLAGAFGVLHHIPNVGEVLREVARVLAPGAPLLIREPIVSLGDFRKSRPGLTANERGIPPQIMAQMLADAGLVIRAHSLAGFPVIQRLALGLGIAAPWENRGFVALDAALSRAFAWNARYWRPHLWDKVAPTLGYWVCEKLPGSRQGLP